MKKIGRALIVSLLASTMIVSTVFAEPSVNQLQQNKANTEKKIKKLEEQMTSIMEQVNATEKELVKVGQEVIKATEDLEEAEAKEQEQYEAMKRRIVAMYENGNTSMISMILEAGSIAEMLQQAENIQTIHAYDRKQLEEYAATKEKIANLKVSLEEDMAAIEKKQAQLEDDKADLNSKIAKLEDQVDDINSSIQRAAAAATKSNSGSIYVPPSGTGGGAAIVAAAYKYLGVDYVWGGASSSGVDCSGLVLLAHKAIGVNLDHYSGSQGSGGRAVSRAEALPGDVVCYSGHVGIYIGNGQMIHAPQTGDVVKIVNVYGSPWFRRYW